jgi:hypothetical protein
MPTKKSYDQYRERPKTRKKNLLNINKNAEPSETETKQIVYNTAGSDEPYMVVKKRTLEPTSIDLLRDRSSPVLEPPEESPPPSFYKIE